jgi:hypothetical protein
MHAGPRGEVRRGDANDEPAVVGPTAGDEFEALAAIVVDGPEARVAHATVRWPTRAPAAFGPVLGWNDAWDGGT